MEVNPKIYIAGWTGEVKYRKYIQEKYSKVLNVFDPMKEVEANIVDDVVKKATEKYVFSKEDITKIVEGDKAAILSCDILTAFVNKITVGTMMEIIFAFDNKIPVYLIDPSLQFRRDIWVNYHSTMIFDTIDDCYGYIKDRHVR